MTDRISELKAQRFTLVENFKRSAKTLRMFEDQLIKVRKRYDADRKAYEKCDMELAMIDGRFKKYSPGERPPPAPKELTEEQIRSVAIQLGITLDS